jgi:enoyl-CoA hydratase
MSIPVTYESHDGLALITIQRSEARNAINEAVSRGLANAWARLAGSEDRAAVLTAAGDDYFTVGADVNDLPKEFWRAVPGVEFELDKPIVAAVAGWCVGGGLVIVGACDLCVATENTKFLYPEAKLGLSGGLITLIATRLPHKAVMELLLVGDPMSAERAHQLGLVNRLVERGRQVEAATEYGRKLADNAPLVLAGLKMLVRETLPMSPVERMYRSKRLLNRIAQSQDLEEGVAAFRGKRKPRFRGR